jgi:hypothetical protein
MTWFRIFGLLICVVCAQSLSAANPGDIDFRLRLGTDARFYRIGEPIEFEISYSTQSEKTYQASWTSLMPELSVVALHLTPAEGFLDLRELRRGYPIGLSIISGGPAYLGSQPVTQRADMTAWYRSQKPGHYSLTVTSNEVWRQKAVNEGGGQEHLNLESNPVEFDILPADPSWEAQELDDVAHAIATAKDSGERYRVQSRLALLDTPASVQKLIELYLSSPNPMAEPYAYYITLSSRIDLIIPSLEAALIDSSASPPGGLAGLFADLEVRKQFGVIPAYPDDPEKRRQWQTESDLRSKAHDEYLARANALLLGSIGRRQGSQRSSAIYEAWYNAESQNATSPVAPEMLAKLRLDVLAAEGDLNLAQQTQFVSLAWQSMPHDQLLPMIRNLAKDDRTDVSSYKGDAFKLWCEGWPSDCSAEILSAILRSGSQITPPTVLLMSEAERQELDSPLEERLKDPAMLRDSMESQRAAALILRVGSRNLLPFVRAVLTQSAAKSGYNCQVVGYLLGYLFRFSPDDAESRFVEQLQGDGVCSSQLFRILNIARYSDELIPVAIKALNSPNLEAAGTAALFLGEHGSPTTIENALWQRLSALWNLWQNKGAELQVAQLERGTPSQSADLEQDLASALSHSKNWKLTQAEQERLWTGCLTEQCQSIAEGKTSRGL